MDSTIVSFGIDKARYHVGDLEGTYILNIFQNSNKSVHSFQTKIMIIIADDSILINLDDKVNRYIEICTLFDSPFLFRKHYVDKLIIKIKQSERSNIFMLDKMEKFTIIDEKD